MNARVTFIGFEDFDNLGVGYISSVLKNAGYEVSSINFRNDKTVILQTLRKTEPLIVGFSLIFQFHIYKFAELIDYLRNEGIVCHFSGGGHYASLACGKLFEIIPSIDSIVRFDGEYTFLDLVNCINTGKDWKKIHGIAYKESGQLIMNPLRPVEKDLDNFPFPLRQLLKEYALGKKFATIIAGRGCINNCCYCSMRDYYRSSSGPIKRIRQPEKVVEEMDSLYRQNKCSVFLFQDDDFPVNDRRCPDWIERFCRQLDIKRLTYKIIWKINCRPDEITHESFALMKEHGLFLVFIGIEEGTDAGLARLNKHMTVEESLYGINILKKLDIGFDYGFMPFHPATTYKNLRENFDFLRVLCAEGYTSATFLKMIPFFSTVVERRLRKEGRLKVIRGFPDYDFPEESLNHYHSFIADCFQEWVSDKNGLINLLKWLRNYLSVFMYYYELIPEIQLIREESRRITDESNLFFLDTLDELAILFESGKFNQGNYSQLEMYREKVKVTQLQFNEKIINNLRKLILLAEVQKQYHFV
jgi:radical SAM superfamily enzyme YgiQ (UPF0313 family)